MARASPTRRQSGSHRRTPHPAARLLAEQYRRRVLRPPALRQRVGERRRVAPDRAQLRAAPQAIRRRTLAALKPSPRPVGGAQRHRRAARHRPLRTELPLRQGPAHLERHQALRVRSQDRRVRLAKSLRAPGRPATRYRLRWPARRARRPHAREVRPPLPPRLPPARRKRAAPRAPPPRRALPERRTRRSTTPSRQCDR